MWASWWKSSPQAEKQNPPAHHNAGNFQNTVFLPNPRTVIDLPQAGKIPCRVPGFWFPENILTASMLLPTAGTASVAGSAGWTSSFFFFWKMALLQTQSMSKIWEENPNIKKFMIRKDTCTPGCTAALLTTTKTQKQPECPSASVKKTWDIQTGEYYSAPKKAEMMPFAATWTDLEIILIEVRQRKTNIIWCHLHVEYEKNRTNELTKQKETHRFRE